MSAPAETTKQDTPESPTTVKPFDLDDDDIPDSSMLTDDAQTSSAPTTAPTTSAPVQSSEAAPPKPPRPMSEAQKNELTLKEAFPSVDDGIIKAVLRASGGHVEPAFNALLGMQRKARRGACV
jgi:hypothetical protein